MKNLFLTLALLCSLAVGAFATDVTISAAELPGFVGINLPPNVTTNPSGSTLQLNATTGSTTLTCSTCLQQAWVGLGGFTISLGGVNYKVAAVPNRSTVTLATAYAGSSGLTTTIWYSWVELRIYVLSAFTPAGETVPQQPGEKGSRYWFRRYAVSIISDGALGTAYLPEVTLKATTDAHTGAAQARYFAAFYLPNNTWISDYTGFTRFCVTPLPNPTTWLLIQSANCAATPTVAPTPFPTPLGNGLVVNNNGNLVARTLQAGTGITITNPSGVSGNPVINATPPTISHDPNYWETITVSSTVTPSRSSLEFSEGLKAEDDSTNSVTRLQTRHTPTGYWNIVTDFGGNGDPMARVGGVDPVIGSISSGSTSLTLTVQGGYASGSPIASFRQGNYVAVHGAGTSGGVLIARVTAANRTTGVLTLSVAASTTVAGARVEPDNWQPIQDAINKLGRAVYIPAGFFRVYNPLNKPIVMRRAYEGQPLVVEGTQHGNSWIQFWGGGSGFVSTADDQENVTFRNLSLFHSATFNEPQGWAIDFSKANVVNYPLIENVRVAGWRGGLYCSNCQGWAIRGSLFRANKQAGVIIASDETVWASGKEPNVGLFEHNQIDTMADPMTDNNTSLTGLSSNSNSTVITSASPVFVSDHVGRLFRCTGCGTTGGDAVSLIQSVDSATQITLASPINKTTSISGKTGTIYRTPFAAAYFLRSNYTTIKSTIIQGNFGSSTRDIDGLVVEASKGFRIENLWVEDNGGSAGASVKLIDTTNAIVAGLKTNNQGACTGDQHCWDLSLLRAKWTKLEGASGSLSIKHFNFLDTDVSEIVVDCSELGNPDFVNENGPQRIIYTDCVSHSQYGNVNKGTATMYDATYGEQYVTNPRFDDGLTGWTQDVALASTAKTDGAARYRNYVRIDTTALADAAINPVFSQIVSLPDGLMDENYVVGFDYRLVSYTGAAIPTGGYVDVSIVPSTLGTGYNSPTGFRWQVRSDNSSGFETGRWYRAQFNLKLPVGTGRTFTIQIRATRGADTPVVDFTNFRLMQGRHLAWSNDQPITELKGGTLDATAFITLKAAAGGGTRTICVDNNGTINTFGCGGGGGGGGTWGSITGTLSAQTDLQTALNAKVTANGAIVAATKAKITYDTKGLVTAGADLTAADVVPAINLPLRAVTAAATLLPASDGVLLASTAGGSYTITINTPSAGQRVMFAVKKTTTDANAITLSPASGTINGAASYIFSGVVGSSGETVWFIWDGTNWHVL